MMCLHSSAQGPGLLLPGWQVQLGQLPIVTRILASEPSSLTVKLVGPWRATTNMCVSGRALIMSRTACAEVEEIAAREGRGAAPQAQARGKGSGDPNEPKSKYRESIYFSACGKKLANETSFCFRPSAWQVTGPPLSARQQDSPVEAWVSTAPGAPTLCF